jgi:multiple sugar transport system permease protein
MRHGVRVLPTKAICLYGAAVAVSVYLVAPFSWLVLTSLMHETEVQSVPPHWIPHEPTLANYRSLIAVPNAYRAKTAIEHLGASVRNSLVVSATVAAFNTIVGSMAAYSLARMKFPGSNTLMFFYLVSRMVPAVAIMIPLYLVMHALHLLDNILSLIIAYTTFALPFTIWILRSYFQTIPQELEDAAQVDGCNWLGMMIRVFLPVTTPALVAALMLSFLSSWSDFLFAVIFTSTEASRTVTVAVAEMATDIFTPRTLMAAGGVLAVIPPLVFALIFQRLMVQGLVSGAAKG